MKLGCYAIRPDAPPIRACPATRAWMDGVIDGHAYRCLPLTIANSHGWEILSPFGFSATWTGAGRPEAISLLMDGGGMPPPHAVVSQALTDAWQRDYFVGRTPEGESQSQHVTRLRLKEPARRGRG